ncbi:MAG: D-alanyl-D-alanine carboxypeptidase/D-alanyl-D-alanine endopeptidase [Gammaproteobacteria bacterium]
MRELFHRLPWWLVFVSLLLTSTASANGLPDKVKRSLKSHRIKTDDLSIVVQAVDDTVPRLSLNADVPRNPASTVKLVTTWTALDLLGPTYVWDTEVYALGTINNGVLDGDLLIKGYGDPYFVLEDVWKMLGQLRQRGLREIAGDLVLDDSHFDITEPAAGDFDGEAYRLYNVVPNALMINFKSIDFIIDPDATNGSVTITTEPELPNLSITSQIKLKSGACRGSRPSIHMRFAAADQPDHLIFSGGLPATCRHYRLSRTAMTPQSYGYGVVKSLWSHWGGSIQGEFRHGALTRKQRPLLIWHSRHLGELIRPLNKWSNNVMTRMLLYTIAETRFPAPVTRAQGVTALTEHLASRGFDVAELVIDNGSGLSRDTRLTAAFMTQLLSVAWKEPTMPEFVSSLAIAGRDGTLRKRFRRGKGRGRMHLKTGSLQNVSSIAGYVHSESGKTFAVTVLINGRNVNYGSGRDIQDAVLNWVVTM